MLDISYFRIEKGGNPDAIKTSQLARNESVELVDEIISLDKEYVTANYTMQQIKQKINQLQKEIAIKIKNRENYDELLKQKTELGTQIKQDYIDKLYCQLQQKLTSIANIVHPSVPVNSDEANNEIVRVYGFAPNYNFKIRGYAEIMKKLDMVDTDRGTMIAGHRGYFLKDYGVLLNQALINYALAFLKKKGYTLLQPPYYMYKDIIKETVQLSDYDENLYKMVGTSAKYKNSEEKYLIATSEQPISAYHRKETIMETKLPIKYCGLSTCFRKEAGAHGKDVQGIFRVHQFEKVEQFCITKPEDSWTMFEEMIKISEEFYQSLGLHYRIVNIVATALNNAAAKKYDLEAWFPETNRFRELVSCSNCTDYQSVSMDIRLKRTNGKSREFVHCLNSTLCATERTLCCLAETYQQENGITIPEVLQTYVGTDFIPYVE